MSQPFDTEQYRLAPSGEGEQASEWTDKPHRLVYDLCAEIERLQFVILGLGRKELLVPTEDRPIGWAAIKARMDEIKEYFNAED